ncbi:phosphorylcholine phosphatase [Purpureocillium lavendulum]|uniref:Phosphorylcholine phosphatase n=1 Tax=Purpureocillium lavendulum TaxID=1247861 RepID=A0AB34FIL2_9HYPO|nr:phosphorylcholine phosphatase [Purpureocillium lavendulum]
MQSQLALSLIVVLAAGAQAANTIVRWHGCGGEYQQTETTGDGCTNVSGFKTENLCKVVVPPPGTDRCEFYTTGCGNPFGSTYYCNAGQTCDTASWDAIDSYRCYA